MWSDTSAILRPSDGHRGERHRDESRPADAVAVAELEVGAGVEPPLEKRVRTGAEDMEHRGRDERDLEEVAEEPALPESLAFDEVHVAGLVPDQDRERRAAGRDEAGREEAAEVREAGEGRVDVQRDHRAPEEEDLRRRREREDGGRRDGNAGREGARKRREPGGDEAPERADPDREDEGDREGRVDGQADA